MNRTMLGGSQRKVPTPRTRTGGGTLPLRGLPQTDIYITPHWIFTKRSSRLAVFGRR